MDKGHYQRKNGIKWGKFPPSAVLITLYSVHEVFYKLMTAQSEAVTREGH